jgi:ubiquinone/menaquinone biosynthesis C-methylase UbiE
MPDSKPVDGKFYEVAAPRSLGEKLLIAARDRIYRDFLELCTPRHGDAILDVGVSDVVTEGANVLERCYPYPEDITALGLGDGAEFHKAWPAVRYLQIAPNTRLPFADRSFRLATANAVLEHVGSRDDQRFFVRELCRVAEEVFITVPNRFFPVEHHTAIPLAHYWDRSFRTACRILNKAEWSREENLILMRWSGLAALAPEVPGATVGYTGIRLGPFSSNLFLHLPSQNAVRTQAKARQAASPPLCPPAPKPLNLRA